MLKWIFPPPEKPVNQYIGGRHWAFLAAEQIIAVEERQQAEGERLKRKDAIRQLHEDRDKVEAEALAAAAKAEAEDARMAEEQRRDKQRGRKELQKERGRLRGLLDGSGITEPDIEKLCASLQLLEMREACDDIEALGGDEGSCLSFVKGKVTEVDSRAAVAREEMAERLRAYEAEAGPSVLEPWSDEEVRLLDKALNKFPQGTAKRWDQISAYLRTRTVDEVVRMVKVHMAAGNTDLQRQSQGHQIAQKRQGNLAIRDQATNRAEVLTDVQLNLKGEAAEQFSGSAAASEEESGAAAAAAGGEEAWSEVQELALVKALKAFGKDLGPERWVRVAEAVPGKSKVECFRRFKQMKDSYKSTKDNSDGKGV